MYGEKATLVVVVRNYVVSCLQLLIHFENKSYNELNDLFVLLKLRSKCDNVSDLLWFFYYSFKIYIYFAITLVCNTFYFSILKYV